METVTLPNDCCEVMNKWWEAGWEREMGSGWDRNGSNGKRVREGWETDGWGIVEGVMGEGETDWVKIGHYGSACDSSGSNMYSDFLSWTHKQRCSQMQMHLESGDILSDCLCFNKKTWVLKAKTELFTNRQNGEQFNILYVLNLLQWMTKDEHHYCSVVYLYTFVHLHHLVINHAICHPSEELIFSCN